MSTSELPGLALPSSQLAAAPGDPSSSFERELLALANQFFSARPGAEPAAGSSIPQGLPLQPPGAPAAIDAGLATPGGAAVSPPAHFGPSALAMGAGGVSPQLNAPPVPGFLKAPPLSSGPLPKESDLRTLPAMFAETANTTPVALAKQSEAPNLLGGTASPAPGFYFLEIAGPPTAATSTPSPTPAMPGQNLFPQAPPSPATIEPGSARPSGPVSGKAGDRPQFEPELSEAAPATPQLFDPHAVKRDFPILNERVHGRPLVWLDNAATTQKPRAVIERLSYFYEHENSNIHRAAHALAARASDAYEAARETTRRFLNAPSTKNIVFVRGTTEAINLVAQSWGRRNIGAGDEILITWLEHHANIVPWQMLCKEKGARLIVAPVDDSGQVLLEDYERLISPRTRLVAFGQVSNALGTIVPAREMIEIAHRHGAKVLVDGAQSVSHQRTDVQLLDCDFFCFSGHKIFGPTGIGALYGKADVLESMPPWQGGGNMIDNVSFEKTSYRPAPDRFEAGTGNIADAVGLGAALDYVTGLGLENIARHEHELLVYATERLLQIPGFRLFGTAREKAAVLSFLLDGHRPEDVGAALDREGIAVRAGHHCAQPILRRFGVEATVRASLAPYNTREDIDALVSALTRLQAGHPGR